MQTTCSSSILAALATLKSLSDEKKYQSSYQILGEFIKYIIISTPKYAFSAIEMKDQLYDQFGFSIPEAVVKTSLKRINGVSLSDHVYHTTLSEIKANPLFDASKSTMEDIDVEIIPRLTDFIKQKTESFVSQETVTQELIHFLVEDQSTTGDKYSDLIGEFILKNESNQSIQDQLNKIREGSILYIGLSHNINEIGSLSKKLSLYLGTEILFSLAGYNGEIYRQLAEDFFKQVRCANANGKEKITLYYFADIKKEIEDFFATAEDIVDGRRSQLLDKPAMIAITNGCKTSSDVTVKKADFYHMIQYSYGIKEDSCQNYYEESNLKNNLEHFVTEEEAAPKKELAIKLISNINKLRNGHCFSNDLESEYLIVTNTKIILSLSKKQSDENKKNYQLDSVCNYAVSLDRITSLLWYKLGKGFGENDYPVSVNALLKARVILSMSIAKNADRTYTTLKKQHDAGLLTDDQMASRIIMLKDKPLVPEEVQGDDIDSVMDFSPEYLSRFEEQYRWTNNRLQEKEALLDALKQSTDQTISERNAQIASQETIIKDKDAENRRLQEQLSEYKRQNEAQKAKKEKRKYRLLFIWGIVWKLLAVATFTAFILFLDHKFSFSISPYIYGSIDAAGMLGVIISVVVKERKKYKDQSNQKTTPTKKQ